MTRTTHTLPSVGAACRVGRLSAPHVADLGLFESVCNNAVERTMGAFRELLSEAPQAMTFMCIAGLVRMAGAVEVVVAGEPDEEDACAFVGAVYRHLVPNCVTLLASDKARSGWLGQHNPAVAGASRINNAVTAYVCRYGGGDSSRRVRAAGLLVDMACPLLPCTPRGIQQLCVRPPDDGPRRSRRAAAGAERPRRPGARATPPAAVGRRERRTECV